MKKLFLILGFLLTTVVSAQTGTTVAGKFRANTAIKDNNATRVVVQDSITKEYRWILKSSLGGGSQTLQQVSDTGGFTNGSTLREGSVDNGFGGGISRVCAVGYESQWENGVDYYFPLGGNYVYAKSVNGVTPNETFDNTKNWAVGSYYYLANQNELYKCTDDATGAAVWELQSGGTTSTLEEILTQSGNVNNPDLRINFESLGQQVSLDIGGLYAGNAENSSNIYYDGKNIQYFKGDYATRLNFETPTVEDKSILFPNKSGTVALTSDITTATLQDVTDEGNETSNSIYFTGSGNHGILYDGPSGVAGLDIDDTGGVTIKSSTESGGPTNYGFGLNGLTIDNGASQTRYWNNLINVNGINYPLPTGASSPLATEAYVDSVAGGGDALVSNPLSQFASTTSSQLAGVISNETGTGFVVFSDSPTLSGTPNAPTQSANDNTTKIATTAYADAKVQNSLSASTTVAPSATAVNNALNDKATKMIKASYTSLTGVTGTQVLSSLLIPANWIASGDGIEIIVTPHKSVTASAIAFNIFSDTVVNGVTNGIATGVSLATTTRTSYIQRILVLDGTTMRNSLQTSIGALIPGTSGQVPGTFTFNPTVDNYITINVNPTVGSETNGFNQFFVRKL